MAVQHMQNVELNVLKLIITIKQHSERSEVHMAMIIKTAVFWDVMLCNLVHSYQGSRETCHLQLWSMTVRSPTLHEFQ